MMILIDFFKHSFGGSNTIVLRSKHNDYIELNSPLPCKGLSVQVSAHTQLGNICFSNENPLIQEYSKKEQVVGLKSFFNLPIKGEKGISRHIQIKSLPKKSSQTIGKLFGKNLNLECGHCTLPSGNEIPLSELNITELFSTSMICDDYDYSVTITIIRVNLKDPTDTLPSKTYIYCVSSIRSFCNQGGQGAQGGLDGQGGQF